MTVIPFAEWTPDAPDFGNGTTVADGVIPRDDGSYGPFSGLTSFTDALTARCQGAFAGKDSAANVANFAGDASKLYKLTSGVTMSDVSRTAGYATPAEGSWRFCQFGNRVIASNFNDEIQSYVLGTSSLFSNLAAAAPKARQITVIEPGFVMAGNTYDAGDGNKPNRVWWCEYLDPTSWPTPGTAAAQAAQSDFNDLPNGGWVQAITGAVGGASGAVFMEDAIYRMDYAGPPIVFQFSEVEKQNGTPAPNSVVNVGPFAAYLGNDDFYIFDGVKSVGIGSGKVAKYIYDSIDQNYYNRIWGVSDPVNKLLIWGYPSEGGNGNIDSIAMFNYATKRWSSASVDCEVLFRARTSGYTLEQLDSFGTMETLQYSLDSRVWTGGALNLAGFTTAHKMGYFNGDKVAATIETGEFPDAQNMKYIDGIRPIVDGGTVTACVGYRANQSSAITYTTATSADADGVCSQRISARYARAKVSISGSWNQAVGIEPRMTDDGER